MIHLQAGRMRVLGEASSQCRVSSDAVDYLSCGVTLIVRSMTALSGFSLDSVLL